MTHDEIEALCAEADRVYAAEARTPAMDYLWMTRSMLPRLATALRTLAQENETLRKERAFLAEHGGRIQRRPCEWDQHGKVLAREVLTWNFEPRRSTVSFTDFFATFDEALAHLMAQATAIDAARAEETTP